MNGKDPMIGKILFNKYTLIKKLGEGSFGCIYSAKSENNWYALKLENKSKGQNLLENEAYIMSYLHGPRIPFVKSFGYSGDYNVLVMELMGKSLEDIFENLPIKKMTVSCVAKLGYQMIEILEFIHNKHIIHRDIKPDNFIMGRGEKSKYLYLLDFGLAKKYRSSTTLKHYPMIKKKNLTGTARYASINALNGLTQSRRDDLEAVGYVLLYFLRGKLPWQGLHVKNKEDRYRKIMEIKKETSPAKLCKNFPSGFEKYVSYTRKLEYEENPDYNYLKKLFNNILIEDGNSLDYFYDWEIDTKTVNTITTTYTSQKAILKQDKKEINEDNFPNILDNEINEFQNKIHKSKKLNKIEESKFAPNLTGIDESNNNNNKIEINNDKNVEEDDNENKGNELIMESNENNVGEDFDDDDYNNIAKLTEEDKDDHCRRGLNSSGQIHNKGQLEKCITVQKVSEENCCYIF